jgi:hypothetical protein
MDNFDVELQLLAEGIDLQSIGDHERKTSPLISRDAANKSTEFSQRGLLGSVLSLHAEGLPHHTQDPRLYLNLAAPASGLVCGVQVSLGFAKCRTGHLSLLRSIADLLYLCRVLVKATPFHAF